MPSIIGRPAIVDWDGEQLDDQELETWLITVAASESDYVASAGYAATPGTRLEEQVHLASGQARPL